MVSMKKISMGLLCLLAVSCTQTPTPTVPEPAAPKKAKNIIFLIGDGMGISQVTSSYYFGNKKEPNFSRFPVIGLIGTSSSDSKITDSAAGATAFASGIKTYNGAIGVDANRQPAQTLIERIEDKHVSSGLIATSSITHATPACFYAHDTSRSNAEAIAAQLPTSGVDFFAGGGSKFFNARTDGKDMMAALQSSGFEVSTEKFSAQTILQTDKKHGYLLAENGMLSKLNGRDDFLPEATALAIDYLSKQKDEGFFLMIEGSQIDWEGHETNVKGIVDEVLDLDKAIGVALDFAEKNGETLVIVTADHETGGFALSPELLAEGWEYDSIEGSFYKNAEAVPGEAGHTATMVPVFAYGPQSLDFAGIYQNNDIFHKMLKAAGW